MGMVYLYEIYTMPCARSFALRRLFSTDAGAYVNSEGIAQQLIIKSAKNPSLFSVSGQEPSLYLSTR